MVDIMVWEFSVTLNNFSGTGISWQSGKIYFNHIFTYDNSLLENLSKFKSYLQGFQLE